MSQFSTFTLSSKAPFLEPKKPADLLGVQTRFASGGAALAIANNPDAVAAVLGLSVPSAGEQASKAVSELAPDEQQKLCELAAKDFDDLTDPEKEEVGKLTGFLSNYDSALHADVRSACEDRS